jgi:hypothetical protein
LPAKDLPYIDDLLVQSLIFHFSQKAESFVKLLEEKVVSASEQYIPMDHDTNLVQDNMKEYLQRIVERLSRLFRESTDPQELFQPPSMNIEGIASASMLPSQTPAEVNAMRFRMKDLSVTNKTKQESTILDLDYIPTRSRYISNKEDEKASWRKFLSLE